MEKKTALIWCVSLFNGNKRVFILDREGVFSSVYRREGQSV